MKDKKPNGYWQDPYNAIMDAIKIKEKYKFDNLPSSDKLTELCYSSLACVINKYYGGFQKFREVIGEEQIKVKNGLWENFDYMLERIKIVMNEHGFDSLPSPNKLSDLGYNGLCIAIFRYHGGFKTLRKRIGSELRRPAPRWSEKTIVDELKEIIKNLGYFPKCKDFITLGKSYLLAAIGAHGGVNKFREQLGCEIIKRPTGYWHNWEILEKELKRIIDEAGNFPSGNYLEKNKLGYLKTGIYFFGGFNAVRKKMGYDLERKPDSYWKNWDNVKIELEKIITKTGNFPGNWVLAKLGKYNLINAIRKHHGGFDAVRKKMSQKEIFKPSNYWKDWNNVETEIKSLILRLDRYPSQNEMINAGLSGMIDGIYNHHGGFISVREKMGYPLPGKTLDEKIKAILMKRLSKNQENNEEEEGLAGVAA